MTQSHVPLCHSAHGVRVAGKQWSGVCVHACDIGKECTVDGGVGRGFCASSHFSPALAAKTCAALHRSRRRYFRYPQHAKRPTSTPPVILHLARLFAPNIHPFDEIVNGH